MCFSADASLGAAVVLLPVGGYCAAAAIYKDRTYMPLAVTPFLFGVQQLGEAVAWLGLDHNDPGLARAGSRWFLLFALADEGLSAACVRHGRAMAGLGPRG